MNMSQPNCYLLSSHDDFSVVSMLPPDAAVLTQLRDPLDRFLSAYEFAVEVASRTLRRPKNYRKKVGRIATEDVWPWSYLVPFFAEDIRTKVEAAQAKQLPPGGVWAEVENKGRRFFFNKVTNESRDSLTEAEAALGILPPLDPYDNELVISLKDFAKHPISTELLHNGASFQVLGITNYSHWGDAGAFRACLRRYDHLHDRMLEVAKARIQRFTHVGTTDRLFESAASALVSIGLSVDSPGYSGGDEDVAGRGGTRQSAARAAQDQSGGGGAGQAVNSEAAAKLQLLAKLVREARRRLQDAQRELVDAQKANSDPSMVTMLQNKVDSARNELIDAQERLASVREMLPADLGGGGAQDMDREGGSYAAQAARRRLLQDDSLASGQQTQAREISEASHGSGDADAAQGPGVIENATSGGLSAVEEQAEHRRRLASKVTLPTVDAFGNQLDPEYKRIARSTLGMEFVRCANRAQERSSVRRDQSLSAMSTADGRRVSFSKAARQRIPQEVLDLIRSYNTLDMPLHKLGLSLLDRRIAEQKEAQLFKDLPEDDRRKRQRMAALKQQMDKQEEKTGGDELR